MGWNLPGITMSLVSFHNYVGDTVKSRKNDKKFDFSTFDCDPEIVIEWLQQHDNPRLISHKKHYDQLFFHEKKKIPSDTSKMSFWRFWDRTWEPFWESKIFFSVNLTYSCTFLRWNLPRITMSLESFHNYFGDTVKSWKNDQKFDFFDFWLWSRNSYWMTATAW